MPAKTDTPHDRPAFPCGCSFVVRPPAVALPRWEKTHLRGGRFREDRAYPPEQWKMLLDGAHGSYRQFA